MLYREVLEIIPAQPSSDGAGVKLKRVFGGHRVERFDPFLLLDELGSDEPADYMGGFPPHPHRGFETVTYLIKGKLEHRDHLGNQGILEDGGVQWMTAGKGIIHSEMPQLTDGYLHGFQIWLNLPAADKMKPAGYRDIAASQIPVYSEKGVLIRAIAGRFSVDNESLSGKQQTEPTRPLILHLSLSPGESITLGFDPKFSAQIYAFEGEVLVGETGIRVAGSHLARLSDGNNLLLRNTDENIAQCLILGGIPLREPIAQYGPFVMNTSAEIEKAIRDYQSGTLTD